MSLPGPVDAMFHFVTSGRGMVRGPDGSAQALDRYFLAIVPIGVAHSLECGSPITPEHSIEVSATGDGCSRMVAGPEEDSALQVACGVVHVAFGDSLGLFQNLREVVVADLSSYPQVRAAFEYILAEQGSESLGSTALMGTYMSQCLIYLLRHLNDQADSPLPWLSALEDPQMSEALDAMLSDVAAPHTVESLAFMSSLSRSRFAERFRDAFGCTPMTFLRDVRLRRAAVLLQNRALAIDEISARVGFASRSHFTQIFTARFGVAPASYRESAS